MTKDAIQFFLGKLVALCTLCKAPPEVQWSALVFYQRFFSWRSPLEVDPKLIMFCCVHLACKVEECREITLDRLLEFGGSATMKKAVEAIEMVLLEGIRFTLRVEPKPQAMLRLLVLSLTKLHHGSSERQPSVAGEEGSGEDFAGSLWKEPWHSILTIADALLVEFAQRTDAVLLWPTSVVAAAALSVSLLGHTSHQHSDSRHASVIERLPQSRLEAFRRAVRTRLAEVAHGKEQQTISLLLYDAAVLEMEKCGKACDTKQEAIKKALELCQSSASKFAEQGIYERSRHSILPSTLPSQLPHKLHVDEKQSEPKTTFQSGMEAKVLPSCPLAPQIQENGPEIVQSVQPSKRAGHPRRESKMLAKAAPHEAMNACPSKQNAKSQNLLHKGSQPKPMKSGSDAETPPVAITWKDLVGTWQYQVVSCGKSSGEAKTVHVKDQKGDGTGQPVLEGCLPGKDKAFKLRLHADGRWGFTKFFLDVQESTQTRLVWKMETDSLESVWVRTSAPTHEASTVKDQPGMSSRPAKRKLNVH
jgi:hypothetical protein